MRTSCLSDMQCDRRAAVRLLPVCPWFSLQCHSPGSPDGWRVCWRESEDSFLKTMWRYCNSEKNYPHTSLYIHGIHGLGGSFTMALLVVPPTFSTLKTLRKNIYILYPKTQMLLAQELSSSIS